MDWFVCKNLVLDRDFLESLTIGGANNEMEGKGLLVANQSSKVRSRKSKKKKKKTLVRPNFSKWNFSGLWYIKFKVANYLSTKFYTCVLERKKRKTWAKYHNYDIKTLHKKKKRKQKIPWCYLLVQ